MPQPNNITLKGLRAHIDEGKPVQNGFGYNDFVRMMTAQKRPSFTSVGAIFNRSHVTIHRWWMIYNYEKQSNKE